MGSLTDQDLCPVSVHITRMHGVHAWQSFMMDPCRPEDAADLEPLADMLFAGGRFPVLDGADTLQVAKGAVVAALQEIQVLLEVEGDERRAGMLPRLGQAASGASPSAAAACG